MRGAGGETNSEIVGGGGRSVFISCCFEPSNMRSLDGRFDLLCGVSSGTGVFAAVWLVSRLASRRCATIISHCGIDSCALLMLFWSGDGGGDGDSGSGGVKP